MSFKLLPKSTEEFSDSKFWEGFFKTRGSKAFEWYGEYQDMLDLWAQYVKTGDRVLNLGCGNSELGAELHDRQGCEVLCVDTSATVVQQMARKHCASGRRPRLAYRVMDAARLDGLADGEFACAVDKGTLDALMSSADSASGTVDAMLAEAHRVLRVGGRHLIVSLCQRQVVDKLLEHITVRPWIARVHQSAALSASDPTGFPLPVFFIALTKLRPPADAALSPGGTLVQVRDAYSTGPPERLDSVRCLADWIRRTQLTAYALARPAGGGGDGVGDVAGGGGGRCRETQFAYACGRTGLATFACRLLTHASPSRRRSGYAVFIEPLDCGGEIGAETSASAGEWRRDLLESQATLRRLLFVRLHPWLHYDSIAALQASLSRLVMAFAPRPGMPESQVPFLQSTGRPAYPYGTVARAGGYLVEEAAAGDGGGGGELRLLCPDSDLAPLQCRASAELTAKQRNTRAAAAASGGAIDSLAGLLDALMKDAGDAAAAAAFVNWPCDLDWLLLSSASNLRLRRLAGPQAPAPVLDLLADRFGLDYRAPTDPSGDPAGCRRRLVVLFPPADSLEAYAAALSPESLAGLADSVDVEGGGGRLVVATRLFDKKAPAVEANAGAAAALRRCGRFADVACVTFDVAAAGAAAEVGDGHAERLRYWVACASATAESATRAADLLAGLPGALAWQPPPPPEESAASSDRPPPPPPPDQ